MTTSSAIGQKLWNYCDVLRDAGLSYGDYLEQLTYLLFLKMMHERSQPPFTLLPDYQPPPIPDGLRLAQPAVPGRRRVGDPLPAYAGKAGPTNRHLGRYFPQGAE